MRLAPAEDLARLLLTTVMGLRVLARLHPAEEILRGAARQALALLDPATETAPRDRMPPGDRQGRPQGPRAGA